MTPELPLPLPSDRDRSGRSLGAEELVLLQEVLESGNLFASSGTKVFAFERELATLFGVPFARAVSSGSAAVHTALAALDVGPGDEVITTPITDMGAIAPILFQGAVPVFADVDPDTLNVTAETIGPRITARTRAVIVTHLFGNPCEMGPILALAAAHRTSVLEDAAQAYLATYHGGLVGTLGEIGVFSLQQTKHMTCGEGGFVLTASEELARRTRVWADKGWAYAADPPDHELLGLNYRMTELQGAVALAQLRKLRGMVAQRVRSAELLRKALRGIPGLRPLPSLPGATQTYWKFVLLVDRDELGAGPAELGAELRSLGIANSPSYIRKPAFLCPPFQERRIVGRSAHPYALYDWAPAVERLEDYPGCREGLAQVLVLPWTERHEEHHVAFIAGRLRAAVEQVRRHRYTAVAG